MIQPNTPPVVVTSDASGTWDAVSSRLTSEINTLPAGNNLGWIRPQCGIIESRVTACRVYFSRLLYVARACTLLVSFVKMNVSLPINQWRFL